MDLELTPDELEAISEGLDQLILNGFADGDDSPITTAFQKIRQMQAITQEEL